MVYDLRTNVNLSLVSNPLSAEHLADFERCFCGGKCLVMRIMVLNLAWILTKC